MVLLDVIISHGPQKGLLLRLFRQGPPGTKEARRFLSQVRLGHATALARRRLVP